MKGRHIFWATIWWTVNIYFVWLFIDRIGENQMWGIYAFGMVIANVIVMGAADDFGDIHPDNPLHLLNPLIAVLYLLYRVISFIIKKINNLADKAFNP